MRKLNRIQLRQAVEELLMDEYNRASSAKHGADYHQHSLAAFVIRRLDGRGDLEELTEDELLRDSANGEGLEFDPAPAAKTLADSIWQMAFGCARCGGSGKILDMRRGASGMFQICPHCKGAGQMALGSIEDQKTALANEYVEKVGYNPFEDDPTLTVADVRKLLQEWKAEA